MVGDRLNHVTSVTYVVVTSNICISCLFISSREDKVEGIGNSFKNMFKMYSIFHKHLYKSNLIEMMIYTFFHVCILEYLHAFSCIQTKKCILYITNLAYNTLVH